MADGNPPAPAKRATRRRRYPALTDQNRILREIPVPRNSSRVRVRVNVDPSSSESEEERLEAGGPSNVPRVGLSGPDGPSNVRRRVGQRGSTARNGPRNVGPKVGQQGSGEPRGSINVGPIMGHQGPGPSNAGSGGGQTGLPRTGLTIGSGSGSTSIDPLIGRSVSGVIGPSLARRVYHLSLTVPGSPDEYAGVLFLPGTFNPFIFAKEHNIDQEGSPPLDCDCADPAEANTPLVGGAINWPALNVGGPVTGDDIASEKALKQAASRLTKIPDNVKITNDLLSDVIRRVQNNSASRHEPIKEVEKQVEEALAVAVKVVPPVPSPDNTVIIVDSDAESAS